MVLATRTSRGEGWDPVGNTVVSLWCYAKSLQSCPTLWDPIDGGPVGSSVPGILQARTLEWVAISFSSAWKWKMKVKSLIMPDSERPHGLQPTRLFRPWDFPGKSTGVGCHCLLPYLFTSLPKSLTSREADHTLVTWLCMHWWRGWSCTDHVAYENFFGKMFDK